MASNPPAKCCTQGSLFDGKPAGKLAKIDNKIDIYIATPPKDKAKAGHGILYMPDVFGIWPNSQLIADLFAQHGYITVVLDLYNGDSVPLNMPEGFDVRAWLKEGSDGNSPHTIPYVDPTVELGIKFMRDMGVTRLGAVGYCHGAKYVIRHLKNDIDVGFVAHPSGVLEDELGSITGPLSIAAAETDSIFTATKRHESEVILKATKQPYQINLFSGVSHGFAVRCDLTVPTEKFAKEQAFSQATAWFDHYLITA